MNEDNRTQSLSLEDTFLQIEEIIDKMEQQEITLEESFTLYQKGVEKLKICGTLLDEVEKKMEILDADEEA